MKIVRPIIKKNKIVKASAQVKRKADLCVYDGMIIYA